MTQTNNSDREHGEILRLIPWAERIADHNSKIDEYLRNCIFRGYSEDTSIKKIRSTLNRIFKRIEIEDFTHEKVEGNLSSGRSCIQSSGHPDLA
jgi:hypothetical protein